MGVSAYEDRVARERETFADQDALHEDLPPAFHHWSARHFLPKLRGLGVAELDDLVLEPIRARAQCRDADVVVLSLGSGNGDRELEWLRMLRESGIHNVRFRLLELNPVMQRRAAERAEAMGVGQQVDRLVADFNAWRADQQHDVVIGHHALHHVFELEHLFDEIHACLAPDGVFVVHDMIGRNGHRRWPEALESVERVWSTLPDRLRVNAVTGAVDEVYSDLDCAVDGFEGIRAQDVLPALLERFHPGLFLAYGSVIDPFVDRIYGANYDLETDFDRAVIEHLGTLDDALIDLGIVTPTHLTATFHPYPVELRCHGTRTPRRSVRDPAQVDRAARVSFDPEGDDPHGLVRGAAVACGRMNGLDDDGWAGPRLDVPLFLTADVASIDVTAYLPEWMPDDGEVTVMLGEQEELGRFRLRHGLNTASVPVRLSARRSIPLTMAAGWDVTPARSGGGDDRRRLSYVLTALEIQRS